MPTLVHEDTQDGGGWHKNTQKIPGLTRTESSAPKCCPGLSLDQGCSPSAPVTFGIGCFFVVGRDLVHCSVLSTVPGPYPL